MPARAVCSLHCATVLKGPEGLAGGETSWGKGLWVRSSVERKLSVSWGRGRAETDSGAQGGKAGTEAQPERGGGSKPREGRKPRLDSAHSSAQQVPKALE